MRIGIDARIIKNSSDSAKSEVASYTYNLIKKLIGYDKENNYVLFFDSRVGKKDTEEFKFPNVEIVYFPFSTYRQYLSYAYSQFIVSGFIAKQKLDVFHACAGTMPLTYSGPTVLTIFEMSDKRIGNVAQRKIIKKAKLVIVKNKELKKKIMDTYKIEEEKIMPMEHCGHENVENIDVNCVQKYLEIYTVVHNSEIKDSYLLKLPMAAFSTVAKPIKKVLEPVRKMIVYPVKKISRIKKKK